MLLHIRGMLHRVPSPCPTRLTPPNAMRHALQPPPDDITGEKAALRRRLLVGAHKRSHGAVDGSGRKPESAGRTNLTDKATDQEEFSEVAGAANLQSTESSRDQPVKEESTKATTTVKGTTAAAANSPATAIKNASARSSKPTSATPTPSRAERSIQFRLASD